MKTKGASSGTRPGITRKSQARKQSIQGSRQEGKNDPREGGWSKMRGRCDAWWEMKWRWGASGWSPPRLAPSMGGEACQTLTPWLMMQSGRRAMSSPPHRLNSPYIQCADKVDQVRRDDKIQQISLTRTTRTRQILFLIFVLKKKI